MNYLHPEISPPLGAAVSGAKAGTAEVRKDDYPFIETLRGFASVFVLLTHTRNWFFDITTLSATNKLLLPFYFVTALARESVIVFFVVSGFLVGGRAITAVAEQRFSAPHYFAARFSRIYIAYVPALLITLLLLEAAWHIDPFAAASMGHELLIERVPYLGGWRSMACHAANLQGVFCPYTKANPALWSQGYEWVLYIVAPIVIYAFVSRQSAWSRTMVIAWVLMGTYALILNPLHAAILGGIWFLSAVGYQQFVRSRIPLHVALAALAVFCGAIVISRFKILNPYLTDTVVGISLATAMSNRAVLMIAILPRISRFLASLSFSLYVTHLPVAFTVLFFMRQAGFAPHPVAMGLRPILDFGFLVVCCIAFAYAFSRMTEAHTARFRRWLLRPDSLVRREAA